MKTLSGGRSRWCKLSISSKEIDCITLGCVKRLDREFRGAKATGYKAQVRSIAPSSLAVGNDWLVQLFALASKAIQPNAECRLITLARTETSPLHDLRLKMRAWADRCEKRSNAHHLVESC